MIGFVFELLIGLLVCGLVIYLVRWIVTTFALPQPIVVIVSVLIFIAFLYWCFNAFPAGAGMHGRVLGR